jgi:hypothetical protein
VTFGGRGLCVLVLHSAGTDSSLTLLLSDPAECNTSTHSSRPANATGPIKVVLNNCLVQQNKIQVHMKLEDEGYVYLYCILLEQIVI